MFRRASAAWLARVPTAGWLLAVRPFVQPGGSSAMVLSYGYPLFYPALSRYPALILRRLGASRLSSWILLNCRLSPAVQPRVENLVIQDRLIAGMYDMIKG